MPKSNEYAAAQKIVVQAKENFVGVSYDEWIKALDQLTPEEREEAKQEFFKIARSKPYGQVGLNSWGVVLANSNRLKESIELFSAATEIEPDYLDAARNLGLALSDLGKYDEAIEQFRKTIAIDPGFAQAHYSLANLFVKMKRYGEAYEEYDTAVKADPKFMDSYDAWGNALAKEGKRDEAIEIYRRASLADPKRPNSYFNWGVALENQGKLPEAMEMYQKTADVNPQYALAYFGMGNILRAQKEFSKSIEYYRKATDLDPRYAEAFNSWGASHADLGEFDQATEQYRKAIELTPDKPYLYENLAGSLANVKKFDDAIAQYRKALDLDPNRVIALRGWGNALVGQEKYEEALPPLEKAAQADPRNVDTLLAWGEALLKARREREAEKRFNDAIAAVNEKTQSVADCHYYWGNILSVLGRIEEAAEKYQDAIRADFDHAYSYHNLAYYREKQGRYKESWEHWESAARAYKNGQAKAKKDRDSDFFGYFGSVLGRLGRPDAEETYLDGLELNSNNVNILANLIDLYLDQKEELISVEGKLDRERRSTAHAKAREAFRRAESILKEQERNNPSLAPNLKLGLLYLAMEDYAEAEKRLLSAAEQNKNTADERTVLGVLYARKEEFQKAIDYFREALRIEPQDLTVRSNLAETYLNAKLPDKAEAEYQKILNITSNHIESEIGLGQVYLAMAEAGNVEMFEEAISHFERAIELGKNEPCSVSSRMKPKKWAALYYSIAYTRVKFHGASKFLKDDSLLNQALKEIRLCLKLDSEHYKALRAKRKILEKIRPTSTERIMEKLGPLSIFVAAAFLLVVTQFSFYGGGRIKDLASYISISFGSIVLMIAGLSLPRLLKLKVAGIELEKSSVEQITTSGTLEISK